MHLWTSIGSFCWRCGCGTIHCINLLLAFLAMVLTGLVFLNNLQKEVPLPDMLARWAFKQAAGDQYAAVWSKAVFDLRGGLYLENCRIFRRSTRDTILEAETVRINWALLHLLFGVSPFATEFSADRLELFIPASHSPSGLNESVAEIQYARLWEKDGQLIVDDLLVHFGGLRIFFSGSAPVSAMRKTGPPPLGLGQVDQLLARIQRLPLDLEADLQVDWSMDQPGNHRFSAQFLSDTLSLPAGDFHRLHATALFQWSDGALTVIHADCKGLLDSLEIRRISPALTDLPLDFPIPFSLTASGPIVEKQMARIPSDLRFTLRGHPVKPLPVQMIRVDVSLLETEPQFDWSLMDKVIFATGTARKRAPSNSGTGPRPPEFPFHLDFHASLREPFLRGFFPDIPDHRLLDNARAGYLRIDAQTTPDGAGLTGILTCDQLHLGATDFSHIRSGFTLRPSSLQLSRAYIRKSRTEEAFGSYFHDFSSSRFSLNAKGIIFPSSLDALLGPWWMRIFANIEADSPLPGDVSVWGHWRDLASLKSSVGVVGDGAVYRGIPVPSLKVGVRRNRDWAYLHTLEATFESGRVEGSIGWAQNLEDEEMRPIVLDLRSDADWSIAQRAAGIPALETFQFEGSPNLEARGTLWDSPKISGSEEKDMVPDLRFSLVHRSGKSMIAGLTLSGLNVSGEIDANQVRLNSVSGKFAEGIFIGRITVDNWKREQHQRHLELQLFDADYLSSLSQITSLLDDPTVVRSSMVKDTTGGRMDTDLDLILPGGDSKAYGRGRITLRQVPLGQIHVFGGLSRALAGMGLGFTSLELNAASLDWSLSEGLVEIPRCLVTGPVLNLDVTGILNLENRSLNLVTNASFFSGIISKVLTPMSDNLQFDVTGSIDDPEWRLRLNPFRWFQNRIPHGPEDPVDQ